MAGEEGAPGTEVHQQGNAQVANTEIGGGSGDTPAERPEFIPEKFWDADKGAPRLEAWAKSYSELESAHSRSAQEKPEEGAEGGSEGDDPSTKKSDLQIDRDGEEGESQPAPLTQAITAAANEYAEKGELGEETIKSLTEAGVDENTINTYVAGLQALQAQHNAKAFSLTGGEQGYNGMVEWAKANLSKEQIALFDRQVSDPQAMESAVSGLFARFQAAEGVEGKSVKPVNEGGAAISGYSNKAEMIADMSDPRYSKDPAFRTMVQRRVAASKDVGISHMQAPVQT